MEHTLIGMPASPGIVVGPIHLLHWEVPDVPPRIVADDAIDSEIARFHATLERARDRLRYVRERAEHHAGSEEAAIFDAQLQILRDHDLLGRVESLIRQNHGAEKAFDLTMMEWRHLFGRHTNPLVRERVGDITDLHIRVLSLLLGLPDHDPVDVPKGANAILVTHDLTPSLTVQLDRDAIAAIATDAGTRTSHVAILARSLGIPAVVGLRDATTRLHGQERAILDGAAGLIVVGPSDAEVSKYQARAQRQAVLAAELALLSGAEPVTIDNERVTLRANVDLPEEADQASHSGAEGVGLMRTEFLVVGRTSMPDEEEQYRAYRRVVESFGDAPVIIRTYDIGGDKLPVGGYPSEPNPFLGWRSIRMCLDEPSLFKEQLRALLRAAVHGDVRILLPLVVTVEEVLQARSLLREAAAELVKRDVAHREDVKVGVMIETPAAAVAADTLAPEADFFSIGTNDLVQYTLAIDRGNANLAQRFTPLHPSVLRLIQRTVTIGREAGLEVAVCGEMASEPLTAYALIGLGIRDMSVSSRAVPLIKRLVRGISAQDAGAAATEALNARSATGAEAILRSRFAASTSGLPFLDDGLPGLDPADIIHS